MERGERSPEFTAARVLERIPRRTPPGAVLHRVEVALGDSVRGPGSAGERRHSQSLKVSSRQTVP